MKKPNLTQSILKDYLDFFDINVESCGLAIRKRHFEKIQTPQSDVQKLGSYFEYMATGYCHDENNPPIAEIVYKGTAKEKMAVDYERATKSAELFKKILELHNIQVIKYGEYMFYEDSSGISDIRAIWNGEECIIDLKFTALFDDKFNDYGWHTDSLVYKSKLLLQPIHYKYLIKKIHGIENIPFYFFIFSSKDAEKVKIIKTNIQEEHINLHEQITVENIKNFITYHYNNPEALVARPHYLRCKDCAYHDDCDKRTDIPLVEDIYY